MDLGFVIPLGSFGRYRLLRRTADADRGAYAFIGTQTLLTCAVAGMAIRMWVRDDPGVTAPLLVVSTGGAAAFILLYVLTVTDGGARNGGGGNDVVGAAVARESHAASSDGAGIIDVRSALTITATSMTSWSPAPPIGGSAAKRGDRPSPTPLSPNPTQIL